MLAELENTGESFFDLALRFHAALHKDIPSSPSMRQCRSQAEFRREAD